MPPGDSSVSAGRSAGVWSYLKAAFGYHWNLLFFFGAVGAATLSGRADALLPIVGGLELLYLTGLMSMPRFRTAIDARVAAQARQREVAGRLDPNAQQSLQTILSVLPPASLQRFIELRERAFEMRGIATSVRGQAGAPDSADSIRTPALDRLLFLFL